MWSTKLLKRGFSLPWPKRRSPASQPINSASMGARARRHTKKQRASELSFVCQKIYITYGYGRKRLVDRLAKRQKFLADRFVVRRHIMGAMKILEGMGMLAICLQR